MFGDFDFLSTPIGEFDVGDFVWDVRKRIQFSRSHRISSFFLHSNRIIHGIRVQRTPHMFGEQLKILNLSRLGKITLSYSSKLFAFAAI